MPKPLMRGDQALQRTAAVLFGRDAAAGQHGFERLEQLFGDREVLRIASLVEGDEDFVGQPAPMTGCGAPCPFPGVANVIGFRELTHNCPAAHRVKDFNERTKFGS